MSWNPRKIITNLTKEEFKEWCIENRDNLKQYIDSLADDPAQYHAFEQFILTEYDLRTWNSLIDGLGEPTCKRPGASLSYNYLVGKPFLNGKVFMDNFTILGGENITITSPVYDPKTKTTSFTINGTPAGEWGKIIGNVHDQKDVQAKVIYSNLEPTDVYDGDIWVYEGAGGGGGSGGVAKWGHISGDIEDQADLQEALKNVSPVWGKIKGDILEQADLQKELATKQNEITPANRLDYETLLMNLPSLNTKVLKGNLTLDDVDVYNKTKVDQMIATSGGDYLGYNEEPITEDYKEKSKWADCSAKIYEAIAKVAKKNDWCYIVRKDSDDKLYYQRWMCSGEKVEGQVYTLFQFLFELDIDLTDLQQTVDNHTKQITDLTLNKEDKHQSVTINGTTGTFTEDEWKLLESSSANYIIYKGLGLRQVYFSYSEDTVVYFASFAQYTPANDEKLTPEIATVTVKISDRSYEYDKFTLSTLTDLESEATARESADKALGKRIDELSSGSATKTDLTAERAERIAEDEKLDDKIKNIWKTIYPEGSIYISVNPTSPATLFGGKWEAIKDETYLVTGTSGTISGKNTRTLSIDELPSHTHEVESLLTNSTGEHTHIYSRSRDISYQHVNRGTVGGDTLGPYSTSKSGDFDPAQDNFTGSSDGKHTHIVSGSLKKTGLGKAFNIQPKSLQVYMWKRLPD